MNTLLVLDIEHYNATGVYTLVSKYWETSFTFKTAQQVRDFTEYYNKAPVNAMFAYEATSIMEVS